MDTDRPAVATAPAGPAPDERGCVSPFATFSECPHCAGEMRPEHAHFRCSACGWRDSCCD